VSSEPSIESKPSLAALRLIDAQRFETTDVGGFLSSLLFGPLLSTLFEFSSRWRCSARPCRFACGSQVIRFFYQDRPRITRTQNAPKPRMRLVWSPHAEASELERLFLVASPRLEDQALYRVVNLEEPISRASHLLRLVALPVNSILCCNLPSKAGSVLLVVVVLLDSNN